MRFKACINDQYKPGRWSAEGLVVLWYMDGEDVVDGYSGKGLVWSLYEEDVEDEYSGKELLGDNRTSSEEVSSLSS